jgi:uncharacterized protein (DUF488 family)
MELFSIGHSNYEIDVFISLLKKYGVTGVADVRSHPYSRFLPHFNRVALQESLTKEGICYVFLGRELGARPSNRECYVDGKAVYERIAATEAFREGIQRILKGLKKYKLSLMCAEKDPLTCHRAVLVCQHLRHFDLSINHILKNGDLESHNHLEERMLSKHGFTEFAEAQEVQLSLFAQNVLPTREECLEKAYKLQGDEIAYVEKRDDEYEQSSQSIHNRVHSKECSKVL